MSIPSACCLRGLVVRGPLLASVRHKARINIQKPKLPHWEKARFQRLTKPRLPDPVDARLAPHAGCFHAVEVPPAREDNPLEVLIGKQLRKTCENSRLIIFFHRNSITLTEVHKAWQMLKRAGFTYHKLFNNRIAGHAFSETRLWPVLQLCRSHTALVTCPEPRVAQLLSLQKRLPQLVVIGGVVEDRFMSVADLERYAQLPSVDALRAQFCHLLSAQAAGLSASLGHHQAALVRSLTAYSEPAAAGRQGQEES
ncbi:39S ribosomal protein L10, mitochondrial-like [Amphibalanus amphitrite]|uniref:39S ribosomal protein L10, mitochondrial-like n=1 Tax=Amphibalanus amphitrite TaxID=1232801 RepID=UPI001C928221|nr:39S ribosomal protein L10, mitochondrial-like [Amphibalanus amphitrite]